MTRWLAKITASASDKHLVQKHFSAATLSIEEHGQQTFVVSPLFQPCNDVQEVRAAATRLIANVNAVLALAERPFEGVSFDDCVAERRNGNLYRTYFAEARSHSFSSVTAHGVALGPDGKPLPPPAPQRGFAERMLDLLDRDDRVREVALLLRSEPISYQDLFIAYETVKGLVSPTGKRCDWRTLVSLGWISESDLNRLHDTLGYYHHGHPRGTMKSGPRLELHEVAAAVGDLFRRTVDYLQPT